MKVRMRRLFKMVEKILQLGYRDVKYWPICSRAHGKGRTMYHMIHATDHLEAPKLMYRAYKNLIGDVPADLQIQTAFSFLSTITKRILEYPEIKPITFVRLALLNV